MRVCTLLNPARICNHISKHPYPSFYPYSNQTTSPSKAKHELLAELDPACKGCLEAKAKAMTERT
jgi:hypothetical protein